MAVLPSDLARQQALETESRTWGLERFNKALQEARQDGREASTAYGRYLVASAINEVSAGIRALIKNYIGRPLVATKYLRLLSPDVSAYIAMKEVVEGITKRRRLQSVATGIGRAIEDEWRFVSFENSTSEKDGRELDHYVKTVVSNLNKQTQNYDHKRGVLNHLMQVHGVDPGRWVEKDLFHIGSALIDLIVSRGYVQLVHQPSRRHEDQIYLTVTESTQSWIAKKVGDATYEDVLIPVFQPMVIPPRDWTDPVTGGYLRECAGAWCVVKTRNVPYIEELMVTDQQLVYGSLNAIQRTPWQVNGGVLDVLAELWLKTNMSFGKMPPRENLEKPPKPHDIETNKEARTTWKRAASDILKKNVQLASKRLAVSSIVETAQKFRGDKAIYFPHNLDFRGRLYSIPSGLSPQGHDIAKGLLRFANGKALGSVQAADWLAIHGANLWGHDKVGLQDRVKWVQQNERSILDSAENPLDYLWWTKADDGDKAWQFLAFCFEWAGYKREGVAFVSHMPIALDGSCNGLQHFSAMLRDPIGGAAVNLLPGEKPRDIYQTVADLVMRKLEQQNTEEARKWLAFGITRKTAKRPVMVVPYGGTRHSSRAYIWDHVKERIEDGEVNPWVNTADPKDMKPTRVACNYLSEFMWAAIRETVVAARDAMDWLQKVSQIVSKEEKPLNWTAPSGFKVQQAYPNVIKRVVKTKINGKILKAELNFEVTDPANAALVTEENKDRKRHGLKPIKELDKRRQSQGISPNFVHSLDAAALTYTVDAAVSCGISSFAMIHDSYGTLAAETDTLRECLRQAFCQMYQDDVLARFRDEIQAGLPDGVKLPPLPAKGTLDINLVLQSDFFFA